METPLPRFWPGRSLRSSRKNSTAPSLCRECEGQREGVEGDVASSDVQEPGDAVGGADQRNVGASFLDLPSHARPLVLAALAGIADIKCVQWRYRHRRPARPDRIDGVFVERDKFRAHLVTSLLKALDFGLDVEVGVKGQTLAGGQILSEPFGGRGFDQVGALEQVRVELLLGLDGVAAVDEHDGTVAEDDQRSSRTGEAGQPCQALARIRDVLVSMLVG